MRATIIYGNTGKRRYFVGDKEVSERQFQAATPARSQEIIDSACVPDGHRTQCWPQKSRALAVHPSQIHEQMAHARKAGVPTEFDKTGKPIFTSRGHRALYMRRVEPRRVDYDGGYGDCTESQAARERWPEEPLGL